MIDPRYPVIVGAHELSIRTADAEPVAMMVTAATAALAETSDALRSKIESVRVVKGISPYKNPGALVADRLGLEAVETVTTRIGGNAAYDLVGHTAADIAAGKIAAAIVCGAESMRTRRADKSRGAKSSYLPEPNGSTPDRVVCADVDLADDADELAGVHVPVNFYALVESAIRHDRGEDPAAHLARISDLWAQGSAVAAQNSNAWIQNLTTAEEIATPSPQNRLVAAPYTKLLTSNINVDQGAAFVMCAYAVASAAGIPDDEMVFVAAASGAHDELTIRARQRLDRSPALRYSSQQVLAHTGLTIEQVDHLDLYSCFPASVQLAQSELGIDHTRPFTITGGLTFAGGPFNGYCTQAIANASHLLRGTNDTAFLYGNGGYFSKHSVLVVSGTPPDTAFALLNAQDRVDAEPTRTVDASPPSLGTLEAYTVVFDRSGSPEHAIASVLDDRGARHWAHIGEGEDVALLLNSDQVGAPVSLHSSGAEQPLSGDLSSN